MNSYVVAQLKSIIVWMNPASTAKWRQTEIQQMTKPKGATIFMKTINTHTLGRSKNTCINNIKVWTKITKTKCLRTDLIYLPEIVMDSDFKPSMICDTFKWWTEKGLTRYHQMFIDKGIDTFWKYTLQNSQFYNYLQEVILLKQRDLEKCIMIYIL